MADNVMTANHQTFLKALDGSIGGVMTVTEWLVRQGYGVRVAGVHRAPAHDAWEEFADLGDVMIEQRVEVKHRPLEFTCAEDWPFPDVIVCAKHAWDRAKPKPYAVITLNRAMTHAAIVKGRTVKSWRVESLVDRRYDGVRQAYLLCPTREVTFVALGAPGSVGAVAGDEA